MHWGMGELGKRRGRKDRKPKIADGAANTSLETGNVFSPFHPSLTLPLPHTPALPRTHATMIPRSRPPFRLSHLLGGLLVAVGTILPTPSHAQPGDLSSFPFLRFAPSARAAALGGSLSAVYDDDVNALFYNPALLSPATDRIASLSYLNHLADINAGFLAYGHDVDEVGSFGAGLRFLSWGTFDGANAFGERTGTFRASDVALTLGAARALGPRWRYGASLHVVYSSLETARAAALATDLGVLYQIPAQQIILSASINHLGRAVDSFGPTRDRLPTDVRLALTKHLLHLPLLLSLTGYDLHNLGDGIEGGTTFDHVLAHLMLGGELTFGNVFQVRLGYHHRRSKELALNDGFDFAGISAGFGLTIRFLHAGYAYQSWSSYGGLHWLTLRARL